MKLSEIIVPKRVNLNLKATTKDGVLEELVKLLGIGTHASQNILQTLRAREELGSTGIGKGIAIPHCRSLVVRKTRVAVGRSKKGVSFKSIDKRKAFLFFLIVAPPVGDPPDDYLVALGTVAEKARLLAKDRRYKKIRDIRQFMKLLEELEE
jgi:mannitol/fructose-specific phosphotransferase system IIA component (Ntr-type)